VYDKVNGLVPSNPVTISGLRVGQVKEIGFLNKDPRKVVVTFYLDNKNLPIPRNTIASIVSSDLMGSKEVVLILGDTNVYLKNGDTLLSRTEATLGEEVNMQLAPLKHKAENLISSIDTLATIMNQVLNKNTRANLVEAIEHVKQSLQNLAHMTYNVDTLISTQRTNLARIISNVESISANLKKNNNQVTNILKNFSAVSDSVARSNIPGTVNRLNQTLADLDAVILKINRGEGSIGLLVNDSALYREVEKSARDLNLLLEDIKANPKKYLKVSVF
jgi:phospholipid/cholesterol/gamma-HCH transport system substrate-binding protein